MLKAMHRKPLNLITTDNALIRSLSRRPTFRAEPAKHTTEKERVELTAVERLREHLIDSRPK
jgi:hypothetical protein